jgi:predicted acetyltransferase
MALAVIPVSPAEHPLLRRLYPLYIHDLSEFGDAYALDAEGIWQPDYLSFWLSGSEGAHPLLFQLDGRPVGFAFVGQTPFPYKSAEVDFRLSEFFVLRGERRRGLGRQAAVALFDSFRGVWELTQLTANTGAVAFWRRVLDEYTGGDFKTTTLDGHPAQVFDNRKTHQRPG